MTGSGLESISCLGESFTKSGQDLTVDLSDCVYDVQISSLQYCSHQDEIHATVVKSFVRVALSARRRALEAGTLPASPLLVTQVQKKLDIDMKSMDETASNNQVATMSSEKATTLQSLKDVEREKAHFKVQVDTFGKESEAKAKEVAKITNEMRVAEQGVKDPNDQMEQVQDEKAKLSQALAELEHSTDEISQRAVAQQELVKKSHEEADTSKQLPIATWLDTSRSSR